MLAGQEIGILDVLMITAFGMMVSMAAMVILWWFVIALGKTLAWKKSKNDADETAPTEAESASQGDLDEMTKEDIAAIIVAVGTETGLAPSQYKIISIMSRIDIPQEEVAVIMAAICAQTDRA